MPGVFDIPELRPNSEKVRNLRPWLNKIRRAVMALRVVRSSDILSSTTEFGTTLRLAKKNNGGGGATTAHPFEIADASTTSGTPAAKVTVGWGTLQHVVPTMDTYGLDTAPEHTFSSAGTYNGYLKFANSGPAVTVEWSTSAVPADDTSYSYLLIGVVTVASSGGGYAVTDIQQNIFASFLVRRIGFSSTYIYTALGEF